MNAPTIRPPRVRPLVPVNPVGRVAAIDPERQLWGGFGDGTAKLLISAVAERNVDLLQVLLQFLDGGVEVGDHGERVRLTSEGALVSSSGDSVSCTMVVRPSTSPHLLAGGAAALNAEDVEAQLDRVIREARMKSHPGGKGVSPRVWPLADTMGLSIFAGHQFHEFRFGVVDDDGLRASERLARLSAQFTPILKSADVPIAYLDFPFSWGSGPANPSLETLGALQGSMTWLRVAVGLPFGLTEPIELQLAARAIALGDDAVLSLYNPTSVAPTMGQRFEIVAMSESIRTRILPGSAPEVLHSEPRSIHHVFVEGNARPGFVSEMFACARAAAVALRSGSMTVLQGHTVANWSVESEDAAKRFEDELQRSFTTDRSFRVVARSDVAGAAAERSPNTASLWVGWRCPEQPGVMARLLQAVDHHIKETGAALDDRVDLDQSYLRDVEYLIARVLENDNTCAGKFKIRLPRRLRDALLEPVRKQLLSNALIASLTLANSGSAEAFVLADAAAISSGPSAGTAVAIDGDEPAEHPWATLVFDSSAVADDDRLS